MLKMTTNTPQQLWRTTFEQQATEETMSVVLDFAERLARRVARVTHRTDPTAADDRVHAAIVGTLDGRLRWDPERVPLAKHLCRAIESMVSHELRHATRFRHVSIDDDQHGNDDLEVEVSEQLAASRTSIDHDLVATRASIVVAGLRDLARADKPVLDLIDALATGATDRHEVMELTGMSSRTYHNARRRLVRLATRLPDEVRESAIQAMA